ncbi:MAG: hypothetical protein ACI4I5_00265, partial [Acutalibacteraceae bacterium]
FVLKLMTLPRRGAKLPMTLPKRIHDSAEETENSGTAPIHAAPACRNHFFDKLSSLWEGLSETLNPTKKP